jgi:hypothetical protein
MICMRSRHNWISDIECPFFTTCLDQVREESCLSYVIEIKKVLDNMRRFIICYWNSLSIMRSEKKRQRCQRNETWIIIHTAAMIGDDCRSHEPEGRCRSRRSIEGCFVPK